MNKLKKKSVLFLAPRQYNYDRAIIDELKGIGFEITFFPTAINNDLIYFFLKKINFKLFKLYCELYSNSILSKINNLNFDYVFVIHGHQFSDNFYNKLRSLNKSSIFINYTWDSVRFTDHRNTILDILHHFDRCYSFDHYDCKKYKKQQYLPLFFVDDFKPSSLKPKIKYDFVFIGSLNTEVRYSLLEKIIKQSKEMNLNFFYHIRVSYRFYIKNFLKGRFLKFVNFNSISFEQIAEKYSAAKCVIDIQGQKQHGLTMRSIESLAYGKKLITTNKNIKKEKFYDSSQINIIDINNPILDTNFINSKSRKLDMGEYSLNSWINKMFNGKN